MGAPTTGLSTHDKITVGVGAVKTALPTGGKPSTVRGALGGAASGAASGAALGSIVPGVGTAAGAGVGAAAGGAGGAIKARSAKRAARAAARAQLGSGRQLLVAEFVVCVAILALSPLTDKHKSEGPQAFLRRGSAVCALFFLLAVLSSGGRGPTRVAAAFGGLVTLTLLVSSRDVFTVLAAKFASNADGPAGPADVGAEQAGADVAAAAGAGAAGEQVGAAVADALNRLGR